MEKGRREATRRFLNLYLSYMSYIPSTTEIEFEMAVTRSLDGGQLFQVTAVIFLNKTIRSLFLSLFMILMSFSTSKPGGIESSYFILFYW